MSNEGSEAASGRRFSGPRDRRAVVGLVVSIVSVVGCIWWASQQKAPRLPDGEGLALVAIAIAIYLLLMCVRGWRWDHILKFLHVRHQAADAYGLTMVGYMGNVVLPARGGEVLRILFLAERSDARYSEVFGSLITERILDAVVLAALLLVVALGGMDQVPGGSTTVVSAAVLLIVIVGGAFLYLKLREAGRFEALAARIRPVTRASRQLLTRRGIGLAGVTLGIWALEVVVFSLCAAALDLHVSPLEALQVVVFVSIAAIIPAGPGYIGTFDAAALLALHKIGIGGSDALSCVVLYRFVILVPVSLVGLVVLVTRYGGPGMVRQVRAKQEPDAESSPA